MRISDWRSDVCSSDLVGVGDQYLVGILVPDVVYVFGVMAVDRADEDAARNTQRLVLDRGEELLRRQHLAALNPVDVGDDTFDFVDIKIGRASCRERVYKYV